MFNKGSGIGDITVEKKILISILSKNLTTHYGVFQKACLAYREKAIEGLDDLMLKVKSGNLAILHVGIPVPENHESDYNRALEMLALHVGDTITLSEDAYRKLVDDEWEWTHSWNNTTLAYTNGGIA
jgi:hypothetical protein